MGQQKAILSAADLAPLLGVSRSRVYQLIASGTVPAVREGRAVRIPVGAWEAWLQDRTQAALAAVRAQRESVANEGRAR